MISIVRGFIYGMETQQRSLWNQEDWVIILKETLVLFMDFNGDFSTHNIVRVMKITMEKELDQLQEVIDCLKDPKRRTSRRLVVTALNPCKVNKMALPTYNCDVSV